MEVIAKYNFARVQPRKARLVAQTIINLPAKLALTNLYLRRKKAASKLFKVLESAIANAENNYKLNPDNLKIKSVIIDSGPSYRRRRPKSKGRAVPVRKRTAHIKMILSEIVSTKKAAEKEAAKVSEASEVANVSKEESASAKAVAGEKPKVSVRSRKDRK
jgi:large subunit ribosomal protein L22